MISKSYIMDDSSIRILLWDLDGTLVRGKRYGVFKDYTVPMLEAVFGTAGCLPEMIVSGMTDLQIVEEALRDEGVTREQIRARVVAVATGRIHSAEDLRACEPDALLTNLLDPELLIRTLEQL